MSTKSPDWPAIKKQSCSVPIPIIRHEPKQEWGMGFDDQYKKLKKKYYYAVLSPFDMESEPISKSFEFVSPHSPLHHHIDPTKNLSWNL